MWHEILLEEEALEAYCDTKRLESLCQRLNYLRAEQMVVEYEVFFEDEYRCQHIRFCRHLGCPIDLIDQYLSELPSAVAITDHA